MTPENAPNLHPLPGCCSQAASPTTAGARAPRTLLGLALHSHGIPLCCPPLRPACVRPSAQLRSGSPPAAGGHARSRETQPGATRGRALVLQMPLAEACHVAAQVRASFNSCGRPAARRSPRFPTAGLSPLPTPGPCSGRGQASTDGLLRVVSFGAADNKRSAAFSAEMAALLDGAGKPIAYDRAAHAVVGQPGASWGIYLLGCVLVLMREKGARFKGLRLLVDSAVPEGKGVSSSAAVEVATMQALAALAGIDLEPLELALLCQLAENRVVGAPCGIMDQAASAMGRSGSLLALLCRPAVVQGVLGLPPGAAVWGVDSGVRHRFAPCFGLAPAATDSLCGWPQTLHSAPGRVLGMFMGLHAMGWQRSKAYPRASQRGRQRLRSCASGHIHGPRARAELAARRPGR